MAGEIRERRWHATQRLIDTLDGGVVLELDVAAPEELERFILGFGPDAKVIEPLSLASRVRERRLAAASVSQTELLRAPSRPSEQRNPSRRRARSSSAG